MSIASPCSLDLDLGSSSSEQRIIEIILFVNVADVVVFWSEEGHEEAPRHS